MYYIGGEGDDGLRVLVNDLGVCCWTRVSMAKSGWGIGGRKQLCGDQKKGGL